MAGCRPAAQKTSTRVVRLPACLALPAEQPMHSVLSLGSRRKMQLVQHSGPYLARQLLCVLQSSVHDTSCKAHQGARRAAGCRRMRPAALTED